MVGIVPAALDALRAPLGGASRRERVLPGIRLSETVHAPGQVLARHAHAAASLCLVLRGGFRERHGSRDADGAPSVLIARGPGVEHSDTFGAVASHCFNVELDDVGAGQPAADAGPGAWAAARLLGELRGGADDLVLEGLALELAATAFGDRGDPGVRAARDAVRPATDELRATFTERPSLRALADAVGVHPMHLTRLFRRAHGTSVGEFVRGLRVDFACRELADTTRSLADIAASAGFTDQAHMTRIFRRLTGTTPARYRALLRG